MHGLDNALLVATLERDTHCRCSRVMVLLGCPCRIASFANDIYYTILVVPGAFYFKCIKLSGHPILSNHAYRKDAVA